MRLEKFAIVWIMLGMRVLEKLDAIRGETFDGVVMANLLCRLPDPLACLDGISSRVNEGGVVVITTPSHNGRFTSKDKWLGGARSEASFDALESAMTERDFRCEEPFRCRF